LPAAIALALVSASACATPTRSATPADPCRALPLLVRLGLPSNAGPGPVVLDVVADIHTPDCGAPDCYGTTLHVDLDVAPVGTRCLVRAASVRSQDWVHCTGDEKEEPAHTDRFTAEPVDLADLHAARLLFRSEDGARALLITAGGVFWFDRVVPGAPLHESVPPEDADPTDCCWAAEARPYAARSKRPIIRGARTWCLHAPRLKRLSRYRASGLITVSARGVPALFTPVASGAPLRARDRTLRGTSVDRAAQGPGACDPLRRYSGQGAWLRGSADCLADLTRFPMPAPRPCESAGSRPTEGR
jgi:hypothetical protein